MCEEIELRRYDDTPWGFRLTGGHDFGIPLTVVRVTGGSLAEEAGMNVGDMIIEINGDNTAQITHSEAQQCILEAGNSITLSILRGSPVPAVTPTRGLHTPSVIDRATSSIGSLSEYEHRDNVVSAVSESYESGHEMTEEEIAEKLLESAEVIENNGKNVIGVNFKRFVPKCDFIKNSLVFQTLQEEQIFDQKSEQEQLKKCPTKRFSTFLTPPNRPKIRPPEKKKPEEVKQTEVNESENQLVKENKSNPCEKVCTNCKCKLSDIEDCIVSTDTVTEIENCDIDHNVDDIKEDFEKHIEIEIEGDEEKCGIDHEENENIKINEDLTEKIEETHESKINEVNKEPENTFEKSILNIQNQLTAIRELPLQIQNHISLLEKQLSDILSLKIQSTEISGCNEIKNNDDKEEQKETFIEQENTDDVSLETLYDDDVLETINDEKTFEDEQELESNEISEDNNSDEEAEDREPSGRPMYPLTPLPRPIVLPGGRKWRCPKDAYNEKFIAETLISQAEVLVGSTLGVNFRKYEPPKFDLSNSAVYKLVHNIEKKNTGGIENRPEVVAAEEDFYYHKPIDARQFYLATLPQPTTVPDFEADNQYGH
ncbi:PREDICTED: membrane-associated guanylate kinase, WW and PDZ domain-containing protein 3-like [Diuraphis noxia]|uniref:membrane-associated guanylate kinase, WW and PDZ domain-containing protein 3-like n=1 Tax=Diuraphis noxia TaxID=143948 RepID=UPI00076359A0|nr:PREDICTED: membrane-associated guanylate kinase, WW and PDZ domain-containing protein 3-like [Diuraphis noxia]